MIDFLVILYYTLILWWVPFMFLAPLFSKKHEVEIYNK
jgi:hypothetical protein